MLPDRKMALTGEPGAGKTVTVDRLMASPQPPTIPVKVDELVRSSEGLTKSFVYGKIARTLSLSSQAHVRYLDKTGSLILVLDGLNEFRDYDRAISRLKAICELLPGSGSLVTCRTADYRPVPGFARWKLADLTRIEQDRFLADQPKRVRSSVNTAFKNHGHLRSLCSNPFVFLIAVELIPSARTADMNRAELYFASLLSG